MSNEKLATAVTLLAELGGVISNQEKEIGNLREKLKTSERVADLLRDEIGFLRRAKENTPLDVRVVGSDAAGIFHALEVADVEGWSRSIRVVVRLPASSPEKVSLVLQRDHAVRQCAQLQSKLDALERPVNACDSPADRKR